MVKAFMKIEIKRAGIDAMNMVNGNVYIIQRKVERKNKQTTATAHIDADDTGYSQSNWT